jgi:PTS system nitrogen regulatory IIA component
MPLLQQSLFHPDSILLMEGASSRDEILSKLIDRLDKEGKLLDKMGFYQAVMDREQLVSTGIGLGIAIPHAKLPGYNSFFVAVAILKEKGVDWGAIDGGEVRIVFLIGGPEERQADYLFILSKITEMVRSEKIREKLLRSTIAEDAFYLLSHSSGNYLS